MFHGTSGWQNQILHRIFTSALPHTSSLVRHITTFNLVLADLSTQMSSSTLACRLRYWRAACQSRDMSSHIGTQESSQQYISPSRYQRQDGIGYHPGCHNSIKAPNLFTQMYFLIEPSAKSITSSGLQRKPPKHSSVNPFLPHWDHMPTPSGPLFLRAHVIVGGQPSPFHATTAGVSRAFLRPTRL